MSTNGVLDFQSTNKLIFRGTNSNVVIDTRNLSLGVGTDGISAPASNLYVTGNAYVSSNLEVGTGNLFVDTITSNVGIGTNAPLDTLHINGGTRFAGHIIPTTNATFDIGSAENKVRDLYVDTNSLWIGDLTKIAFERGKMKFKRRKVNKVPRMLVNLAIQHGRTNESDVETHAISFAQTKDSSISSVSDLKLQHWRDYAKTFDETKAVSDIFVDNDEDYEAITASEAFMEVGSNIFTEHHVSIGKTTDPTATLDVEGTVKATALSVGEQSSEQTVTQNYNNLTNIPSSSRASGTWRSHTFGNITLPANWSNDNFQFKVTVNGNLNGVATAEYVSITMKKQGSGTQPSVGLNFNPQNQSSGISSSGGRVYYTNVVVTNSTVSNGSFSAGDVVDIYMSIYVTYWYQLSLAVEIRGGGTASILLVDGTNDRVGIGLTQPTTALDVSGTVKATAFEGDGSALTGIVAGQWTESSGDIQRSSGNVGIGKAPDSGKKLDVNGTVKATAFEGDGSALTGISSGQWTYTAGTNSGTQQLVFDDQAPGTTFTGTLSGNTNNTAIRDTSNRYIRVTQGGTSRIGSVYWQTTLTNNWEATFEIYILPINYGGADDMRFIFYATNPITSNDGATGTNGHGGAYMRWEYYGSDYVELYDHTATRVWQQSASLQMNGWMPVTVTFNNGQLTSTIKNSSGTTLKTTTYDFGTTYSARYNTPTYVAVTGRSGGVQAEDRVRNITINALNVPTGHKLTRMNANVGIDVTNPTQKLDVNGTVKATAFEGDGSALTGISSGGQWTESSGNIYRSSGRVGIGTTSPDGKLHISTASGDHNSTDNALIIGGPTNCTGNTNLRLGCHNDYAWIQSHCAEPLCLNPGGNNVGVNTSNPRSGLHAYVQYPIFGKTNTGSGLICDDIGYAKWRQTCGSYHLTFQRHNSSSSTNYTSWTSRGYLHKDYGNSRLNFTGQHRTFIGDVPFTQAESKEGLIVSANSDTYIKMSDGIAYGANAITINECLPVVTLSQTANDKACFGVISLSEDPETREDAFGTFVSVAEKEKGDTRVFINSVGEGGIWITNKNGTLESGDYVTTSTIPGYGVKQEDDILHNYTVAKITMNCNFNPTLQKVKRIKKKLTEVKYWVYVSNVTVTKEEYDNLQPEFRRIIQDEDGNDIYQTNDRTEWTHNPVEEDGIIPFTEIRNELQNDLDEHGQIQWEDTDEFEKAYKIRYILPDGTQISEEDYTTKLSANEEVYISAFVGCTYHCG